MHSVSRPLYCLSLSLIFALASACSPVEKNETTTGEDAAFKVLLGRWADESRQNDFYETWEVSGNGLTGTGVVMSNGDTVFIEHLAIVEREGDWYYAARIDSHNNGEMIYFKLQTKKDSLFVFENQDHDFPQKIVYDLQASGELLITTSGHESDTLREEKFHMLLVE